MEYKAIHNMRWWFCTIRPHDRLWFALCCLAVLVAIPTMAAAFHPTLQHQNSIPSSSSSSSSFSSSWAHFQRNIPSKMVLYGDNQGAAAAADDNGSEPPPPLKKLGIPIGSMLDPITQQDVMEMKMEATEMIQDVIASGMDDIQQLRVQMMQDVQQSNQQRLTNRAIDTQRAQVELLDKIDTMTAQFLQDTAASRTSTQMAARADQAMTGQGLEMGTWGVLHGRYVTALSTSTSNIQQNDIVSSGLLGSLTTPAGPSARNKKNRILVIADTSSDPYAKQLLGPLEVSLKSVLQHQDNTDSTLEMVTYKPTATVPLGSNNAAALLIFCTSIHDVATLQNLCSRLLRTTYQPNHEIGQPPTQIVVVSTIGTTRIEKMPFSMQNMLQGGKLSKRRQMEEYIVRLVQHGGDSTTKEMSNSNKGMDYTICHLGELKPDTKEMFQLLPGDTVDGTTTAIDTAVTVLTHAMALQPSARNATLSCTGKLLVSDEDMENNVDTILDDAFLRLDGPELLRLDLGEYNEVNFNTIVQYVTEWATMLAESKKGLTTPVRCEVLSNKPRTTSLLPAGILQQSAPIRLLFQPTATGKYYVSDKDERQSDKDGKPIPSSSTSPVRNPRLSKDGGIEFVVEVFRHPKKQLVRVRAKRCNYGPDTVVKELSEATILSQFKKSISVWNKDHMPTQHQ
jgi:hypothetical protein